MEITIDVMRGLMIEITLIAYLIVKTMLQRDIKLVINAIHHVPLIQTTIGMQHQIHIDRIIQEQGKGSCIIMHLASYK